MTVGVPYFAQPASCCKINPPPDLTAELSQFAFQLAQDTVQIARQTDAFAAEFAPLASNRQRADEIHAKRANNSGQARFAAAEPGLESIPLAQAVGRRRIEQQARTIGIEVDHVENYRRNRNAKLNRTGLTAHFLAQSLLKVLILANTELLPATATDPKPPCGCFYLMALWGQ